MPRREVITIGGFGYPDAWEESGYPDPWLWYLTKRGGLASHPLLFNHPSRGRDITGTIRRTNKRRRNRANDIGDATAPEEGGAASAAGDQSAPQDTQAGAAQAAVNAANAAVRAASAPPVPAPPPPSYAAGLAVVGLGLAGTAYALWKHFR